MEEIIKALIRFQRKYKVAPSIRFEPDCGCEFIYIRFENKGKRIEKLFYFVPMGENSVESFENYNPDFEVVIEKAIEELQNAVGKGRR